METLLNDKAVSRLPLAERAKLKRLPEYLSIDEITKLVYPDPETQAERDDRIKRRTLNNYRSALIQSLIEACKSGLLKYEGDITGWEYYGKNPYPLAKNGHTEVFVPDPSRSFYYGHSPEQWRELGIKPPEKHKCSPSDCTIHKDEFKRYLQSLDQWPVDGLLANWWPDEALTESKKLLPQQPKSEADKTKLEKQLDAILKAIQDKKYDPMKIPDGGKGVIQEICENDHPSLFDGSTSFENAWKKGRKLELFRMENHAGFAKQGRKQ